MSAPDIDGTGTDTFTSGESGVYFMGVLPYGTYYLHETKVPTGYVNTGGKDGNWFILTVGEGGVECERVGE